MEKYASHKRTQKTAAKLASTRKGQILTPRMQYQSMKGALAGFETSL